MVSGADAQIGVLVVGTIAVAGPPSTTPANPTFVQDSNGALWYYDTTGAAWVELALSAGDVISVFGRTGVVTAQTGDYTAAKVTNAADKASASAQDFTAEVSAPDLEANGLTGAANPTRLVGATASGSPASGTFELADVVIDQTGVVWICTAAGTPGTWKQVGSVTAALIEGTFTAANQVYIGTGSGTGALAVLANGYGVGGFAANPPTPAVSLTTATAFITSNVSVTATTPVQVNSLTLAAGTWLVNAQTQVDPGASQTFDGVLAVTTASMSPAVAGGTQTSPLGRMTAPCSAILTPGSSITYYQNVESTGNGTCYAATGFSTSQVATGIVATRLA